MRLMTAGISESSLAGGWAARTISRRRKFGWRSSVSTAPEITRSRCWAAYQSAAVGADGSPPADYVDDIRVYQPSTRPGSPLPHAWIEDDEGRRRPLKDLVRPGRFPLIAFRQPGGVDETAGALAQAFDRILARRVAAAVPVG
jgi:hypothetical protein